MNFNRKRHGIRKTLLLWFLTLSLLPMLLLAYAVHGFTIETLKGKVINHLVSVTDNKVIAIRNYVQERKKAVSVLARTPAVVDAFKKLEPLFLKRGGAWEYKREEGIFRKFATDYQEGGDYHDLFLIDPSGDVIFSVAHENDFGTNLLTGPYSGSELAKVFSRAHTLLDVGISDYRYYPPSDASALFIAAPVFTQSGFLGVLALQMNAFKVLEVVSDHRGLGATGETVIGSLHKNNVVFLSRLRHKKSSKYGGTVPVGAPAALPIQYSVLGKIGNGVSYDYRGKRVLAAWRYEPSLRWGMVVKIDTEEAFKAIFSLEKKIFITAVATSFMVLGLALYISRSISRPVSKLTVVAKEIIGGDFTLKIDPEIKSLKNEIGEMALNFEKMAGHLIDSNVKLDEMVKERTEELEGALDKLKGSSQLVQAEKMSALGTMVAGVAHELNNPMMGILNYLQYCRKGIPRNDKKNKILHDAERETDRCIKIVKNLLSFSRLESEGAESMKKTDISKSIQRVLTLLSYRIEREKIKVSISVQPGTPTVFVRPNKIQQVILNLFSNAIDSVHSSVVKKISFDLSCNEKTFFLTIADTGMGIGAGNLKKIFLPFFTTKTVGKGTGLGLSVCDGIVRAHGGEIRVESDPKEGTRFTVSLPLGGLGNEKG